MTKASIPPCISYALKSFAYDPIDIAMKRLYPRLYRIDNLEQSYSIELSSNKKKRKIVLDYFGYIRLFDSGDSVISLPFNIPLRADILDQRHCYIIDDGIYIRMVIGPAADKRIIQSVIALM